MKCEVCAECASRLRQLNLTTEEKAETRAERKVHLDRVVAERMAWHNRIIECRDSLDESVMAIYLDGMDQEKTWIPHVPYKEQDKLSEKVLKVRYAFFFFIWNHFFLFRLIGGLLYRKQIHPYGFFFQGKQFPGDTNSNLECFRRILEIIEKGGKLPKKLYIQMDNTSKDNKNWYFFIYLAYLILAGYLLVVFLNFLVIRHVETIEVYFLPKGHTHGQIDQFFSRLAVFLRRMPGKTLAELRWALYQAYNKPSQVSRAPRNPRGPLSEKAAAKALRSRVPVVSHIIESVVDVAHWLKKMNPSVTNKFKKTATQFNLRKTHAFKFELNAKQEVVISAKNYAVDKEWLVTICTSLFRICFMFFFLLLLLFFFWFRIIKSFSPSQVGSPKRSCMCPVLLSIQRSWVQLLS